MNILNENNFIYAGLLVLRTTIYPKNIKATYY